MDSIIDRDTYRSNDIVNDELVDFENLLLSKSLLRGLQDIGFEKPSPIQLKAIPIGKCGFDLIVQSKNGTGKTCVFSVIALESIDVEAKCIQVLILAPTREIATQIYEVLLDFSRYMTKICCKLFIGGSLLSDDAKRLRNCHIAIATPGRFEHFLKEGIADISSIRLLVLDEADKLLEREFEDAINWIYSSLPVSKQIIACSATMPEWLANCLQNYMHQPTTVRLNSKHLDLIGVAQYIKTVTTLPSENIFKAKCRILLSILSAVNFTQCIVYSSNQVRSEDICGILLKNGWSVAVIGSGQNQESRLQAISKLKSKQCSILVSTDLTSRGLDVPNVDLVINIDLPMSFDVYLHRIGRAGRFGRYGASISLVCEGNEQFKMNRITKLCRVKLLELPDIIPADLTKYSPSKDQTINSLNTNGLQDYANSSINGNINNSSKDSLSSLSKGLNGDCKTDLSLESENDNLKNQQLKIYKHFDALNENISSNIVLNNYVSAPTNDVFFDANTPVGDHSFDINYSASKSDLNYNLLNQSGSINMKEDNIPTNIDTLTISPPNPVLNTTDTPIIESSLIMTADTISNDYTFSSNIPESKQKNVIVDKCKVDFVNSVDENIVSKLNLDSDINQVEIDSNILALSGHSILLNEDTVNLKKNKSDCNITKYSKSKLYEIGKNIDNIKVNDSVIKVMADLRILKNGLNNNAESNLNKNKIEKNKAIKKDYHANYMKQAKNIESSDTSSSNILNGIYSKGEGSSDCLNHLLNNMNNEMILDVKIKKYVYTKDELRAIENSHLSLINDEGIINKLISIGIYVKQAEKCLQGNEKEDGGLKAVQGILTDKRILSETLTDNLLGDSIDFSFKSKDYENNTISSKNINAECSDLLFSDSVTNQFHENNNQLESQNFNGFESKNCGDYKISKNKSSENIYSNDYVENLESSDNNISTKINGYGSKIVYEENCDLISKTKSSKSNKTKQKVMQNVEKIKNAKKISTDEIELKNIKKEKVVKKSLKNKQKFKIPNPLENNTSISDIFNPNADSSMAYFYWSQYQYHLNMSKQYKQQYESVISHQQYYSVFNNCADYIRSMSYKKN